MSEEAGLGEGKLDDVFETGTTAEPEPKGEKDAAPPAAAETPKADDSLRDDQKTVPVAALVDERRKRQALEQQLQEYQKPKEEKVDLFADPDRFVDDVNQRIKEVERTTRINLSREMVMSSKADYEEKETKFVEMAQQNPYLIQQMNQSSNPAKFAYDTAAKQLQVDEVLSDPEAYKAKIRQELLQELGKAPVAKQERAPSLATVSAVKAEAIKPIETVDELFD